MPSLLDAEDFDRAYLWYALPHDKSLAICNRSHLNPRPLEKKFTLVLDLNNTLINLVLKTGIMILRPGIISFLDSLKRLGLFEIILWSTGDKKHVDKCSQLFERYFDQALSRGFGCPQKFIGALTQDGSRTLKDILIIDDNKEVCDTNDGHAILVPAFHHRKITQPSTDDVFEKLQKYCEDSFLNPFIAFDFKQQFLFFAEKLNEPLITTDSLPIIPQPRARALTLYGSSYQAMTKDSRKEAKEKDFRLPPVIEVPLRRKV